MTIKPAAAETPLYLAEFPNFGELPIVSLPEGWKDVSYHNDVCPSFELALNYGSIKLFVDFKDEAERELRGAMRFRAYLTDDEGNNSTADGDYLWETDGESANYAMMLLVALRAEVQDWQDSLCGERPELDGLVAQIDEFTGMTAKDDSSNDIARACDNAKERVGCPYLSYTSEGAVASGLHRPSAHLVFAGHHEPFIIALTLEFYDGAALVEWFEKLTREHVVETLRQRYVVATGKRREYVRSMLENTEATRPA